MILVVFALVLVLLVLVAIFGLVGLLIANVAVIGLALLAGLGISAVLGGVSAPTTIIAAVAVLLLLLSGKRRRGRERRRGFDLDLVAVPAAPKPAARQRPPARSTTPPTPLDLAWTAASENADWARSRLAVARDSCRLFLGVADRLPLDAEAGGLAVRIRRRIPEHVAECLDKCALATASERRAILDELVATLEKVGASADRERARLMGPMTDQMSVQRRHLTRDSDHDPLALG